MSDPVTGPPAIKRATSSDLGAVTGLLVRAFLKGTFGPWLVPNIHARRRVYGRYFRIFADHFLTWGRVDITEDRDAVALWMQIGDDFRLDITDYDRDLEAACGRHVDRFRTLDRLMAERHPARMPHHYLAFLAVAPSRQGQGLGGALLEHRHAGLDTRGLPAYLEATCDRSRNLYLRHGYIDSGPPIRMPDDGPALLPMVRVPGARGGALMERRLIREDERQDIIDRYTRQGQSIRVIADALGRSYGGINKALRTAGVTMRSRGGDRRRRHPDTALRHSDSSTSSQLVDGLGGR